MGEAGVCTDCVPGIIGSKSVYIFWIKQKSPNAIGSHCVIYGETLASRTLSAAIKDKLAIFHTGRRRQLR